jgi:uroporphyrinogen-III synthase
MSLPQSLIDKAAREDVLVDAFSFIHIKPLEEDKINEQIIALSKQSATVVFTSMHAAETVVEKLKLQQIRPNWKIYCMAGTTKKIIVEYFGEVAVKNIANDANSLASKIIQDNVTDLVFFCGNQRRDELPMILADRKIFVKEMIVYETTLTPHIVSKIYNGILFFSPSSVKSFFSVNKPGKEAILFAIGNTTADTLKKYSQNKIIVSESPGKEILVETCLEYFQTHPVYQ